MDTALIIVGAICLIVGLIGCIVPALPGVPISYVGLLLLELTDKVPFSMTFMVVLATLVIVIQVLDTFLPIWTTKWSGGSKAGVWGSTLGLIAGFFFAPWGIIVGPFLGAVIGELIVGKEFSIAIKSGAASFLGFLGGTIIKLIAAGMMIYYFVEALLA